MILAKKMPGTLYLVPTNLSSTFTCDAILPAQAIEVVSRLDYFIVENAKTARHFLKALRTTSPLQALDLRELNEHTAPAQLQAILEPILSGRDGGLLSEAGAPAVADPGAELVALAHECGVRVAPLVGPSAILLGLMASGLNGQKFAFHGYLPVERDARRNAIAVLERESARHHMTQIFIETPYRNDALLADILATCATETRLCIACNLLAPDAMIKTQRILRWQSSVPDLNRKPTIFLLLAHARRNTL